MSRVIVVGAGVAGLTAALEAAREHEVLLLTKADLGLSNTAFAQGGVAVAGPPPDSVASHLEDTIAAGAGLTAPAAALALCEGGPAAIEALIERGVAFDRTPDGALARGLEAAHSFPRILHAGGDATGAEISRGLVAALAGSRVDVRERVTVLDLIVANGTCVGVRTLEHGDLGADVVLLATGGGGHLYPYTTNPEVATGDGVAIALRAGAAAADLEFYQFHPTALAGTGGLLVSEAVRGEGAVLIDAAGHRFMTDVHPLAELAPRDVVARAIAARAAAQGGEHVRLDATALGADFLRRRFPTIVAACAARGYDLTTTPIPVTPAAHYWMGGVATDTVGRTSLPGLWAIGEAACTGVHGANRLASNSLLEGAVQARRAVAALASDAPTEAPDAAWPAAPVTLDLTGGTREWVRADLQRTLWDHAGLDRTGPGLATAAARLAAFAPPAVVDAKSAEDLNLLTNARTLVAAAAARPLSVGAHYRSDVPGTDPAPRHSLILAGGLR